LGVYGALREGLRGRPLPKVDGTLICRVTAHEGDASLTVAVPLIADPFIEPRYIIDYAKQHAGTRLGPLPNREKQVFLADFQTGTPDTGQRLWRVCVTGETPLAELWSLLTLLAGKQGFPLSTTDAEHFTAWLRALIRTSLRDWPNTQQLMQELEGPIHHQLLSHFDQPGTPFALRDYIKKTTIGLARSRLTEERRQVGWIGDPEPCIDEASGECLGLVYPVSWVAGRFPVSERTVRRWMDAHGYVKAPRGAAP
jgi:hypothetical protein